MADRYSMTGTHKGHFAGVEATGAERAQLGMLGILRQMGAIPAA